MADVENPAWPALSSAATAAGSAVRVIPISRADGEASIEALQVTAGSVLGALALNCGGLLVDDGWLRILGGGHDGLPSIADASGIGATVAPQGPPSFLVVAFDILGGRFAIDGGGLGVSPGKVCYWAPDSLAWETTGLGHADFVHGFLGGAAPDFYSNARWPGWRDEITVLRLDEGMSMWPPPFSAEGQDLAAVSRRPVPFAELVAFYEDAASQLGPGLE